MNLVEKKSAVGVLEEKKSFVLHIMSVQDRINVINF